MLNAQCSMGDAPEGVHYMAWRYHDEREHIMRRASVLALFLFTSGLLAACTDEPQEPITGPGAATDLRTLVDVTTGLEVTSAQAGTFNWAGQSFVVPESGSF